MIQAPVLTINGVDGPEGIAVSQSGDIFVTEKSKHCISIFSSSGQQLRSVGTCGTYEGQFQHPFGIALDNMGNFLVADCNNHRIQVFTPGGDFLTAVNDESLQLLSYPRSVAFNSSNNKIYVGSGKDCILILHDDLSYYSNFGEKGNQNGQFNEISYIACDKNSGNIYVADSGNHRIQIFTAEGVFLRKFGELGKSYGKLNRPIGIAIDSENRVYVSECGNHRVSIFTLEGEFVKLFGSKGKGSENFKYPYGIAADNSGVVFVCDRNNRRIQLF